MDFSIKNGGSFHSYVSLPEGSVQKKQTSYFAPQNGDPTALGAWPGTRRSGE